MGLNKHEHTRVKVSIDQCSPHAVKLTLKHCVPAVFMLQTYCCLTLLREWNTEEGNTNLKGQIIPLQHLSLFYLSDMLSEVPWSLWILMVQAKVRSEQFCYTISLLFTLDKAKYHNFCLSLCPSTAMPVKFYRAWMMPYSVRLL